MAGETQTLTLMGNLTKLAQAIGADIHRLKDSLPQPSVDLLDYAGKKNESVFPSPGCNVVSKDPLKIQLPSHGDGGFDANFLKPKVPTDGWKVGQPYTLSVLCDSAVTNLRLNYSTGISPTPEFKSTPLGDVTLHTATFSWPAGVNNFYAPMGFRGPNSSTVTLHGFKLEEGEQSTLLTPSEFVEMSLSHLRSVTTFDTGWRNVSSVLQGFEAWRDRNNGRVPRYMFNAARDRILVRRIGDRAFICLDLPGSLRSTQPVGTQTIGQLPGAFMPKSNTILQYVPSIGAPDTSAHFGLTQNGQVFYVNRGTGSAAPIPIVIEYLLQYPDQSPYPLPGVPI